MRRRYSREGITQSPTFRITAVEKMSRSERKRKGREKLVRKTMRNRSTPVAKLAYANFLIPKKSTLTSSRD